MLHNNLYDVPTLYDSGGLQDGQSKQREVTHQIHKPIGVLSIGSTGWRKEVNIVSWNNAAPKLVFVSGVRTTENEQGSD